MSHYNLNSKESRENDTKGLHFDSITAKHYDVRGEPIHSIATPIYTSSTFYVDSAKHGEELCLQGTTNQSPWLYTRWGNPTNDVAERIIGNLEGGYCQLVASGMSAISSTLLTLLRSGDHAVFPNNIYGGTHEFVTDILPKMGIEITMVNPTDINNFRAAIKPNTKLIYGETPANPTMTLTDLEGLVNLAKEVNDNNNKNGKDGDSRIVKTVVDSTFANVYNQRPLKIGIDIVVHSATKYYGGHSDLIAGVIITSSSDDYHHIGHYVRLLGGAASPFTGFLLQRGLKTLHLRMERHNSNALQLAKYLEKHPKVVKVHYPGLESFPQHQLALKQMSPGFGGMISFEVIGGAEAGRKVIESVKLINLAVSLGGVESLIEQASTMTHTMVSKHDRELAGITDGLLRMSVGVESVDDIINDLNQALNLI